MKKIVIPTDFSPAADNAALYALNLAKILNANIVLCNAFTVPLDSTVPTQIAWPVINYEDLKVGVEHQLAQLTQKLTLNDTSPELSQHPAITYKAEPGSVTGVINNLVEKEKSALVVMGMSGASDVSHFLLGSSSRDMIEAAKAPTLLIPKEVKFVGIKKIAFATDLNDEDIRVINSIVSLAKYFNAEILIAHVSEENPDDAEYQHKMKSFLNDITCKINYPKIYFRHIRQNDVEEGLDWLTEHGMIDVLVMIHKQKSFIDQLFNRSHTQKIAKHIDIPLLVYPGYTEHIF